MLLKPAVVTPRAHMRKLFGAVSVLIGAAFLWLGYSALRAQRNEVTLDVRNEDLRLVIRTIQRQTWEKVLVAPEVQGRITLRVQKAPLEGVLAIIAEQTSSRWTALYPLYSEKKSLQNLEKTILGQITSSESRWTNFAEAPFQPSTSLFDANLRTQNRLISVHLDHKPIDVASMALSRFGQAQIVPEDGTRAVVSLKLSEATMNEAVRQLARQSSRKWDKLYALLKKVAARDMQVSRIESLPEAHSWLLAPEIRDVLEKQFQASLETLNPQERKDAEEQHRRWEEIRELPAEQREQAIEELAGRPEIMRRFEQRIVTAIKNTTPLQRLEWDRAVAEYRKSPKKDEAGSAAK